MILGISSVLMAGLPLKQQQDGPQIDVLKAISRYLTNVVKKRPLTMKITQERQENQYQSINEFFYCAQNFLFCGL